jgi:DNA topoisomerase III
MRVYIAEKPSVATNIARLVGATKRENGYFSGQGVIVTYAFGHMVTEAEPGIMNPAWDKRFDTSILPMIPTQWIYVPIPSAKEQYKIVKTLFTADTTTEIVNATDAGREGEAIFRRIYDLTGATTKVFRLWASSLTDEALTKALSTMKPDAEYDNLAAAASARAKVDWLIGMNYSRAFSALNKAGCSIGRVQTPTLAMIVDRQNVIDSFIRTPYYEVRATHNGFSSFALNQAGKTDFEDKAAAQEILKAVPPGTTGTVLNLKEKRERELAPKLHNLGELQKEANERYGYAADFVLSIAQALYERKLLTYPRSSSQYLSEDMVAQLPAILQAVHLDDPAAPIEEARRAVVQTPDPGKRFIDGTKLSDHHAIIPTTVQPTGINEDETRIYQLVVARFVGMWLPDKVTSVTTIEMQFQKHLFRTTGRQLIDPGWSLLRPVRDSKEQNDNQIIPPLTIGQTLTITDAILKSKKRTPPLPYNDATLLAAMETAGKNIEDENLRELMKGKGIGTEATRAGIIKALETKKYIQRQGKSLIPMQIAIAFIAQIRSSLPVLANPEATAELEDNLSHIEQGTANGKTLLSNLATSLHDGIPKVLSSVKMPHSDTHSISPAPKGAIPCPVCAASGKVGYLRAIKDTGRLGCAHFPECRFLMFVEHYGKKLTKAEIRKLCKSGKTNLIEGFKSKAGKSFSAKLILNKETEWRVRPLFNEK